MLAITIALDEPTTQAEVEGLLAAFASFKGQPPVDLGKSFFLLSLTSLGSLQIKEGGFGEKLRRTSAYLTNPVFNSYDSETEMMRYLYYLQKKDLGLNTVRTLLVSVANVLIGYDSARLLHHEAQCRY